MIKNQAATIHISARSRFGGALLLFFALFAVSSFAQKSTVRATIQPSEILIGEQAIINVEVIAPKGRHIEFQMFNDTLVKGVEVLAMPAPDTVMTEVMTLNQKYLVTSFDSTLYNIPYLLVVDGKDTLRTNNLGLKVTSPQLSDSTLAYLEKLKNKETDSIDFVKLEIKEQYVADVIDPPFVWTDYLSYIFIAMGIFLVLALLSVLLILYLNKRRKGYYFKPKVVLPPHVIALDELEKLRVKQLSQRGLEKEYYTQLTDIVRQYIAGRFGINAVEMISDDIIENVHRMTDTASPAQSLEQMLRLADLVKFAKYIPLPNENDLSMVNAILFINQTKIEEVKPAETEQAATQQPDGADESNKNDAKS